MAKTYACWNIGVDPDFETWFTSRFDRVLKDLRNDSSVGLGQMKIMGPTVGEALGFDGEKYDSLRVDFLRKIVRAKIMRILNGREHADPINIFVKPEPHKISKLEEGRVRLIMAVSLEDCVIDRMLYSEILDNAINTWHKTPVKIGYSPLNGQYQIAAGSFPNGSLSIDKQGWDFTVPEWLVELWRRFLLDLVYNPPSWWVAIHNARFEALYGSGCLFEFKDGTRAKQRVKGLMKSGCFNTILLNSIGQHILAELAWSRSGNLPKKIWCLGDDTVEERPYDMDSYLTELGRLGFTLKEAVLNRYVEFCGFVLDSKQVRPAYWKKHLFLLFQEGGPHWVDKLDTYRLLYAYDDDMMDFLDTLWVETVGVYPVGRQILRACWCGVV